VIVRSSAWTERNGASDNNGGIHALSFQEDAGAFKVMAGHAVAKAVAPPRILSLLEALQQSVGGQNGNAVASRVEKKPPTPSAKERTNRKRARRTA